MMQLHVRLYGVLRDQLPAEDHGRLLLEVPQGATINDVLAELDISGHLHISVNEDMVEDWQTELQDGDHVDVFRPSAGG